MEILSPAFEHEHHIPAQYTLDGTQEVPPLHISGVPAEAVSIALLSHDPDVPRERRPDGNFDHWVVWNISPTTTEITSEDDHDGIVGANTLGKNVYQTPAPPRGSGPHRYYFRAYALDTKLDLPTTSTRRDVEAAMEGHILESAELMGVYERFPKDES